MTAAEPRSETVPADARTRQPPADVSRLHSRRREARRRRRLARVDLGLGLLGAVVLLVATPGFAIAGLIALIVLVLCLVTFALERRGRGR